MDVRSMFWKDPWLFDGASPWVASPRGENEGDLRVCDLFSK